MKPEILSEDEIAARKRDESRIKLLCSLPVPDQVLDLPERFVHPLQTDLIDLGAGSSGAAVLPDLLQCRQLDPDVGEFQGFGNACRLDAQDGDLVEQLTRRYGHEDVLHGVDPSKASSRALTSSTSIRSMTPGFSILVVHGSCCGVESQNRAAARAT